MIWLVVAVFAQSGAVIYLAWAVYRLRKEVRNPLLEYTAIAEEQAHDALKQQRIDQALADFGPPAPKPWPGAVPRPKPSPTPRPDRSAEETGAWPYEGRHAWFGDKTEAMPATPPKSAE